MEKEIKKKKILPHQKKTKTKQNKTYPQHLDDRKQHITLRPEYVSTPSHISHAVVLAFQNINASACSINIDDDNMINRIQ